MSCYVHTRWGALQQCVTYRPSRMNMCVASIQSPEHTGAVPHSPSPIQFQGASLTQPHRAAWPAIECVLDWCPLPGRKHPVGLEKEMEAIFPECWRAGMGIEYGIAVLTMGGSRLTLMLSQGYRKGAAEPD